MEKIELGTQDLTQENIEKLINLFPQVATEVESDGEISKAIDFDALRELLGDVAEGQRERYQFTWPGKREAKAEARRPIAKTMIPCPEKSVNWDTTENLYIEGDNLEALKILRETYAGKVKMIYIDPPYNTGKDSFVYDDDSSISGEEFSERSGQYDEDGNMLFDVRTNNESNGRFHTDWLNMLYPRLRIAKDLLTDDGIIFISIDDNEVENLIKICDEVFGSENHLGTIVVKSNPRGSMAVSELASLHEYILMYAKVRFNAAVIGHTLSEDMTAEYKYKDDDEHRYRLLGLRMRGGFWRRSERPNLYFPLYVNPSDESVSLVKNETHTECVMPVQPSTQEDGTWRWSKEKIEQNGDLLIAKQISRNGEKIWDIYQKDYYERAEGRRTKAKSIWEESEINYQNGTTEIKNLLGNSGIFSYSKPVFLIEQALRMTGFEDNDIVLDFFSGSATTAHAVMQLNAEDGGHRKFIMVQLPEVCDEKSEAYKAGYKNICEIGEERIRRAGRKIAKEVKESNRQLKIGQAPKPVPDIGFRVLRVDSSNFRDTLAEPGALDQSSIFDYVDNLKEGRTSEDLLFQVLPKFRIPYSAKIEEVELAGKTCFVVEDGQLVACFDPEVGIETIETIAKMQPLYAVMRDASMADDSTFANFEELFKTYSPDTVRRVI